MSKCSCKYKEIVGHKTIEDSWLYLHRQPSCHISFASFTCTTFPEFWETLPSPYTYHDADFDETVRIHRIDIILFYLH